MRHSRLRLVTIMVSALSAQPALGLVGETPTIRKMAVGSGVTDAYGVAGQPIAMVLESSDQQHYLRVQTVNAATGLRMGNDLTLNLGQYIEQQNLVPAPPSDLIFSTVFRPGRILVLDTLGRILEFSIAYDANGSPKLEGPPSLDLRFAHGVVDAADYLALAEAPNPFDPGNPFIAVGAGDGRMECSNNLSEDGVVVIAAGPITDLEAVPQVGYFALVAASGGRLIGINPDSDPKVGGLEPVVTFDLTQTTEKGRIDISSFTTGAVFEPNSEPLLSAIGFPVLITDGTSNTYAGWIVPGPQLGDELAIEIIERVPTHVSQGGFLSDGTPCFLTADGNGVFADTGSYLLTLAGATAQLRPQTLKLSSSGEYVTVSIEVENGELSQQVPTGVNFIVGGTTINSIDAPVLGDVDGDGNVDLTVRLSRSLLSALLGQTNASEVLMETVTFIEQQPAWRASAVVRVLR